MVNDADGDLRSGRHRRPHVPARPRLCLNGGSGEAVVGNLTHDDLMENLALAVHTGPSKGKPCKNTSTRIVAASLPAPIARNPYQALLYRHLADQGVDVVSVPRLCIGWLWRHRTRVATLHFHWPQEYYRHDRGPRARRVALSWIRLGLFGVRVAAARLLGYRVVWTVHQVYPHETESRALDHIAAAILAGGSHRLIAHDAETAASLARRFRWTRDRTDVVPHGSYVDFYPRGRSREAVRAELGIPADGITLLSFGQIRSYKNLTFLVEAFEQAQVERGFLLIAGLPLDDREAQALKAIGARNPSIVTLLEYVPDDRVAELFSASDVAVLARSDGGTSGAVVLALSLGLPAIAAATPGYLELTGHGRAGWHFEPGDIDSLCAALRSAAADPLARRKKARHALRQAQLLSWPEIAARTAALLRPDAAGG